MPGNPPQEEAGASCRERPAAKPGQWRPRERLQSLTCDFKSKNNKC